ncbi:isopentenyl-diphosphate Delta-isomerase [Serratia sp. NPDC078593]|uniref:isopentenyl-diphosphate Delta-isomerase n=1 Tax=unclassified Serratia (in: enterobacteria) TaxID=2647522 RepID=UPI0037D262BD
MIEVILVDENDIPQGTMEKLAAHQQARLHRAISVYIFNTQGELLLQRRALNKYHAAGLWGNTCCSHPYPGEESHKAASRRLQEEMGMSCPLQKILTLRYCVDVGGGLSEHELTHIFIGFSNANPIPNVEEVDAFIHMPLDGLLSSIKTEPGYYAPWFKLCLPDVLAALSKNKPGFI